ncbi:DEAD/DEAH box helicase [Engelhardtia mirabilis]|uniref:DEAD-box ATP-dependent RNA helicase CshA n=1 Tax=Engelhardtia mirabilis TaxID=2528011 RepID=A0A518BMF8_9BACT|nr:DEAD-box ATP-dependent RNA helicase CshA [Planctomycetes bacterium Pla133]QDV02452.1 DEAD-box ATP-dependent RNA helicase CshA [Planctomycetes bacterium Pla86]
MTEPILDPRIAEPLRAALLRRGFDSLTTVQEAALQACGENRDLQISSQTGSGKTVALGLVAAPVLLASPDAPFPPVIEPEPDAGSDVFSETEGTPEASELAAVQSEAADAEAATSDEIGERADDDSVDGAIEPAAEVDADSENSNEQELAASQAPAQRQDDAPRKSSRPRGPQVLVIVPTRELAAQVRSELEWLYADVPGVTLDCVTGGTNLWRERERLRRPPRVLVGTPGRLLDHLTSEALVLDQVCHLILDEADQMLDLGFREELEAIIEATPDHRRTHMVSATLPDGIRRLAERYQHNPLHVEGTRLGVANADIEHIACRVHERDRYSALVNLLLVSGTERTLVFVNTRVETSELAEKLSDDGFAALPLSGELAQAQRTRTLAAFRSGAVPILVATDVAARGLDVPEVATVVHTAPCRDAEVYTHRSGRTGRAGKKGVSISMVPHRRQKRMEFLLRDAGIDVEWRPIPSADDVRRVVEERAREATAKALAEAPTPTEEQLVDARAMLEDREPAELVAVLLQMARPSKSPDARDIGQADNDSDDRGTLRPQRRNDGRAPFQREDRQSFQHDAHRGAPKDTVSFRINWGFAAGANPKRLLAHICRRGDVQGREVGAIRLQAHFSTFEITSGAAQAFEGRARERDERDPHLKIQRDFPSRRPVNREERVDRPGFGRGEGNERSGGFDRRNYGGGGNGRPTGGGYQRDERPAGGGYKRADRPTGGGYQRSDRPTGGGYQRDERPAGGGYKRADRPTGGGYQRSDRPTGGGYQRDERPAGGGYKRADRPTGGGYKREERPTGGGYQRSERPAGGGGYVPPYRRPEIVGQSDASTKPDGDQPKSTGSARYNHDQYRGGGKNGSNDRSRRFLARV